ncbi:MAG TPA: FAD-dependent oxidoreductase, partial [Burkholderiaceae bacterium]
MSHADPPSSCDVLVIGAGPAGAACALWLARAGADVALVDQHDFPREKVCGDALIPDAHHALRRLGLHDEVMAVAQPAGHVA